MAALDSVIPDGSDIISASAVSVSYVSASGQSSGDIAIDSLPEPVISSESFEDANESGSSSDLQGPLSPLAVQVNGVYEFKPMVRDIYDFSLPPDQVRKSALVYFAEEPDDITVLPAFVLGMETVKALKLPTFVFCILFT